MAHRVRVKHSAWHADVYHAGNHNNYYASPEWRKLRRVCLDRDHYTCQRCDKRMKAADLQAHHLIPRAEGGPDDLPNLLTLCNPCHDYAEVNNLRTWADIAGSVEVEITVESGERRNGMQPQYPDESFIRPEWHRWVYGGVRRSGR